MAKRKANGALTKITTRAKQIRKSKPNMQWSSAIKQAGADYRSGKLGGSAKRKVKRAAPKRKVKRATTRRRVRGIGAASHPPPPVWGGARLQMVNGISGMSVSGMRSRLAADAKDKLAKALLRRDLAKGVMLKRRIGKEIAKLRANVKKYSF